MSDAPERLAMFPLGSVIFPYSGVPLRVFEPRYQALLDMVLGSKCAFGSVLIERGSEVGGGDQRTGVGTRLRVLAHQDLDDGHRAVVVAGSERIRVVEWLPDDPHPWALVEPAPDPVEPIDDLRGGVRSRLETLLALASELGADTAGIDLTMTEDPVAASYQFAAVIPLGPLDAYRLLAAAGPRSRMELAVVLLEEQLALVRAELRGE